MSLAGLLVPLAADKAVAEAVRAARAGDRPLLDLAAPAALRPFLVAALAADAPDGAGRRCSRSPPPAARPRTWPTRSAACCRPDAVAAFPAWETLPHERLSPRADTVGRRLAVLRRLAHPRRRPAATGRCRVVVAPVRAVLQPQVAGLGDLRAGRAARRRRRSSSRTSYGGSPRPAYTRVDLVEQRGEFAVRGGILDVFPPTEEHPLRVEFWGDEVEEIRYFAVADQRIARDRRARPVGAAVPRAAARPTTSGPAPPSWPPSTPSWPRCSTRSPRASPVEGMESLAPVLVDRHGAAARRAAGRHARRASATPSGCAPARTTWSRTGEEFLAASWAAAAAGGKAPIDLGAAALPEPGRRPRPTRAGPALPWWTRHAVRARPGARPGGGHRWSMRARGGRTAYRGDTDARARRPAASWLRDGWRVAVVTEGHGPAERAVERLREADIAARAGRRRWTPSRSRRSCTSRPASLEHGFVARRARPRACSPRPTSPASAASTKDMRRMPSRRRNAIDPLQLQPGDYVVHEQHGVGRYVEMVQRTVHGATREYLVIEYAAVQARPARRPAVRADRPARPGHPVRRRRGARRCDRLGGADWAKAQGPRPQGGQGDRRRADPAVQRAAWPRPGHAFGAGHARGSASSRTPSRTSRRPTSSRAIDEVKADMEQPVPMDRLICGDVGYGKTEIAVRAAFKAVQDGKQVAVLVPTTLLVAAALRDVLRAVRAVPGRWCRRCRGSRPTPRPRRSSRASPTAASTSSSAPTGCCTPTSGSRTSAWSSSTRSSASASSTRST